VKWLGHSCFYLVSSSGLRVVTDPFGSDVPYPEISPEADVVTISHEHFDHNNSSVVKGKPKVLRGVNPSTKKFQKLEETLGDVTFRTIHSYHDEDKGRKRGENAIFVMEFPGLRLAHLGDLGHPLDEDTARSMGEVDVLLIPVGGYYTIGGQIAKEVVRSLSPRIVIPMHYKTRYTSSWPISEVNEFISGQRNVKLIGGNRVDIESEKLPDRTEIWVLEV